MGGWAHDGSRTRRARHGVAPRRAVSATSATGTAPTSAVRWSRERRALPFEHARDVGRRKHLQSSAAQPSRSDRSQRSRAARDIPCRAGYTMPCGIQPRCRAGYTMPHGIRLRAAMWRPWDTRPWRIRFRCGAGYSIPGGGSRRARTACRAAARARRRTARADAAAACAPACPMPLRATSHADITAALGLSAAQPWRCHSGGFAAAVVDRTLWVARVLWSIRAGGPLSNSVRCGAAGRCRSNC